MRIVSWNIQQGGKSTHVDQLCHQLSEWSPDFVGLSEFRDSATSQRIREHLDSIGLNHQHVTEPPETKKDFMLCACRFPMTHEVAPEELETTGRWAHLQVRGLHLLQMIVPLRSSGLKWKFHHWVVGEMRKISTEQAVCFGDANSGVPGVDESGNYFDKREADWFHSIQESGWMDVWRSRNPTAREYTWYHNSGNGFRLDQGFAPKPFEGNVTQIRYDWGQGGRDAKLSDHAAIVFDVNESSLKSTNFEPD